MGVFSLAGWSRRIRAGFLVSRVTQDTATPRRTSRRGLSPAAAELSRTSRSSYAYDIAVLQPRRRIATPAVWALPRSLATTGGITFCFLFLEVLRCFSSLGWRHRPVPTAAVLQTAGLSHSEIPGSEVICTYPGLIAAYHVLHRLHEPRHPPCALIHFLGSGHQHGRSYFQLYPDKQKCQENFFVEFYSTVSCVNMSKISIPMFQGKCSPRLFEALTTLTLFHSVYE